MDLRCGVLRLQTAQILTEKPFASPGRSARLSVHVPTRRWHIDPTLNFAAHTSMALKRGA